MSLMTMSDDLLRTVATFFHFWSRGTLRLVNQRFRMIMDANTLYLPTQAPLLPLVGPDVALLIIQPRTAGDPKRPWFGNPTRFSPHTVVIDGNNRRGANMQGVSVIHLLSPVTVERLRIFSVSRMAGVRLTELRRMFNLLDTPRPADASDGAWRRRARNPRWRSSASTCPRTTSGTWRSSGWRS